MHIYGIWKNGTEKFIFKASMEKQTQRIDLWIWGEGRRRGGEGDMFGKNNMETYITIRKIDIQQEFAVGNCKYMAQETQTGVLYPSRDVECGGRWEGGSKGRVYMYTYD